MSASEPQPAPAARLVEHFFRHESGRLAAVLVRLFGWRHADLVDDMIQAALVEAMQAWRAQGPPDNPAAWVHRVAKNKLLDALRHRDTVVRLAPAWAQLRPASVGPELDDLFLDSEIADSQLRMIFACCHPSLARENQIALTLKTLCGFNNAEIGRGLLVPEETAKKRVQRARRQLIDQQVALDVPAADALAARLDAVHQCLYLLFNEGYAATSGEVAIRRDLCEEAARLCHLLTAHERCRSPATHALLALMLFHAARFNARTDEAGRLLLLEDQDRGLWDARLIGEARWHLDASAEGRAVSPYHLEAGIAFLHTSAPSFAATDWPGIVRLYDALLLRDSSPLCRLNRAIAVAHLSGPAAGLQAIEPLLADSSLQAYHLLHATLGELHRRADDLPSARRHLERAIELTQSAADQELLRRRLALCGSPRSD
ncbi:MAG: DUF6596 domain-containing protein [Pirellulales bacterium]